MKPVHSSPLPFVELPGHFHAISFPTPQKVAPISSATLSLYRDARTSQRVCCEELSNAATERMDSTSAQRRKRIPHLTLFQALLHQSIVKSHQLRVLVIFQHELTRAQFCALSQENLGAQVAL